MMSSGHTKTVRSYLANYWQTMLNAAIGVTVVCALLLYRLAGLLPGMNRAEVSNLADGHRLHDILINPLFGLYKGVEYIAFYIHGQNIVTARAVSAGFGLAAVILMYLVIKHFHSSRIALLGTTLFASSSWFLTYARMGTPAISYTLVLAAVAYGIWMRQTKRSDYVLLAGTLLALALLYTPGLIWLVIIAVFWQKKTLVRLVADSPKVAAVSLAMFLILLLPLGYSIYREHSILKPLFGLSSTPLDDIGMAWDRLSDSVTQLAGHSQTDASIGLVRAPILDIFTGVMAFLGVYSYYFERKLDRTKMLGGGLLLGVLLFALGGDVNIIILAPFIYILASAGIGYMLETWFTVFPRNPVARNVGLGLIVGAVTITGYYHLNRYFVTWPKAPQTQTAYNIRL